MTYVSSWINNIFLEYWFSKRVPQIVSNNYSSQCISKSYNYLVSRLKFHSSVFLYRFSRYIAYKKYKTLKLLTTMTKYTVELYLNKVK